ncbi:hypothetical protein [Paenibacillus rigui]|uniref:Flagellar protein FliT n=1 Tax=Paenibacillus rigui TaxID=554312 RepID=A0A229URU8_9BACL|nr:hypothetical protein [Paenibacillus rigui]OXM86357.1 hypothetical protein CF651_10510 [Paenibacillus rigui]
MRQVDTIQEHLLTLKQIAERISGLDFHEEDSVLLLEKLQARQEVLQEEIRSQKEHLGREFSIMERGLIQHCIDLEKRNISKMQVFQAEMGSELNKLKQATLSRRHYQAAYAQTEGYFVDKQR